MDQWSKTDWRWCKLNDEQNREVATLMFKASKLTAEVLAEAMKKFLKGAGNVKDGVVDMVTPDEPGESEDRWPCRNLWNRIRVQYLLKYQQMDVAIDKLDMLTEDEFELAEFVETAPDEEWCGIIRFEEGGTCLWIVLQFISVRQISNLNSRCSLICYNA